MFLWSNANIGGTDDTLGTEIINIIQHMTASIPQSESLVIILNVLKNRGPEETILKLVAKIWCCKCLSR